MSFLDKIRGKAKNLAEQHGDKVGGGVDKAADFVDKKTKGKYSDKIDSGVDKVKEGIDKVANGKDDPPGGQSGQSGQTGPDKPTT